MPQFLTAEEMQALVKNVKFLLEHDGITIEELAERMDRSVAFVKNIVEGKRILTYDNVKNLATCFDVLPGYLLYSCRAEEDEEAATEYVAEIEDEDFASNEKLIRFKRARNATCFGQRTINIINQYYNSINEMILIKNDICEIMYDIEKEAFELSIQINIENEDKENKFIFINPKNINAKRGRSERGVKLSKYQKNSNFTSVDEYRKIFKNEINQRSLSITENNKEQTQYEMLETDT